MAEGNDSDVGQSPPEKTGEEILIVLAGKSGAGKSTLAINLLGEESKVELSAKPITQKVSSKETVTSNGIKLRIMDTPGFVSKEKMSVKDVQKKFDLLLYCLPVTPGLKFDDHNPEIMERLNHFYGRKIWKHCVIIFTFSNLAMGRALTGCDSKDGIQKYTHYFEEYASEFQKELRKLEVEDTTVEILVTTDTKCSPHQIHGIPAGDKAETVMPDNWKEVIYHEMLRRCKQQKTYKLAIFRYGYLRAEEILEKLNLAFLLPKL